MAAGTYGGGTFGWPWGGGVGAYIDSHGRLYPQVYAGTPRWGLSAGYTPDLEGLLTGPSASGGIGFGPVRANVGTSGGVSGIGFGTPGAGVTYGFGPYELSDDYSQPWKRPFIRDSAARAGIPSRNNVWEYDYPDAGSRPSTSSAESNAATPWGASGGLLGRIIALGDSRAHGADRQAPAIESRSQGDLFSEGAAPVRFLQRVSGPPIVPDDPGDLRYYDLPGSLADFLQNHLRNSPRK